MEDNTKTATIAATPSNNFLVGPARLPYISQIEAPKIRLAAIAR